MAYKDSDQIANDSNYALGDYSFRIERSSVPGSTNDKIEAICTDKDGHNARKSIQVPSSTQLLGWYVEANETEVTVYAKVEKHSASIDTRPIPQPIEEINSWVGYYSTSSGYWRKVTMTGYRYIWHAGENWLHGIVADSSPGAIGVAVFEEQYPGQDPSEHTSTYIANREYTYDGKTVYYIEMTHGTHYDYSSLPNYSGVPAQNVAWYLVYGKDDGEVEDMLVARFAIELEDAGGVGPEGEGGGWTDPGDYDEDWEEGDPTHTLYVEVTGALSGRHNDPIEDPSYSYIPADKDTVKDYGCGGDGGHGGGGGAGASTVVIHKFATNQANSKEVTAIARRHGYGSGGGKGGRGGDGCILVYY